LAHLHGQKPFVQGSEFLEGCLGKVNMLRVFGTTSTRVHDANEDAFLRRITDWARMRDQVFMWQKQKSRTFEELETLGLALPTIQSQGGGKGVVLLKD
jgi:hypothetical protein